MSEPLSDFTGKVLPSSVEVNGVRLTLSEFDMRTRALWMDISREYGLPEAQHEIQSKVIPKLSGITMDVQSDPRIKSLERRLAKLEEKHDSMLELYATPDEPEGLEEEVEALVERMAALHDEMGLLAVSIQDEIFESAGNAEKVIAEFMELQDRARVDFIWRLAKASGRTELDLDEFLASCDGDDYSAAEKFVSEGNARWASLYEGRMQQKPSKRKGLVN